MTRRMQPPRLRGSVSSRRARSYRHCGALGRWLPRTHRGGVSGILQRPDRHRPGRTASERHRAVPGQASRGVGVVQTPKPIPTSFARESYFAVSAFRFTNAGGAARYGGYRLMPVAGNEYLNDAGAVRQTPNFLIDETGARVTREPVRFRVVVQLAQEGDVTDDSTVRWPERPPVDNLRRDRFDSRCLEQCRRATADRRRRREKRPAA